MCTCFSFLFTFPLFLQFSFDTLCQRLWWWFSLFNIDWTRFTAAVIVLFSLALASSQRIHTFYWQPTDCLGEHKFEGERNAVCFFSLFPSQKMGTSFYSQISWKLLFLQVFEYFIPTFFIIFLNQIWVNWHGPRVNQGSPGSKSL